jgi:hypothetical protein
MKILIFSLSLVLSLVNTQAQSLNTKRAIEVANKETLPEAIKKIETASGAKLLMEVDAKSFGDDEKAWANLYLVVNRTVGAIEDVAKDKIGQDAVKKGLKKIVITKRSTEAKEDSAELKECTLTINTLSNDESGYHLQGILQKYLESKL